MSNIIPITFLSDDHAFWTYARVQETLGKGKPTFSFNKAYDENTFSDVVRIGSYGAYAWPDYIGLIKGGVADKIIQALDDGCSLEMISYETTDTPEGNTVVSMVVMAKNSDEDYGVTTVPQPSDANDHAKTADEVDNAPEVNDLAHRWKGTMDTLMGESPLHGSLLMAANPVSDDGETLVIQLPEGATFALKMLQRSDVGLSVALAVAQTFGPRQVECTCEGGDRVIIPPHDTPDDFKKDGAVQVQVSAPAGFPVPAQPPVRNSDSVVASVATSETDCDVCRLNEEKWQDAIKTMRRPWPSFFRFTRLVGDDGATVTIWVPKWSELDMRLDEENGSFDAARKTAEKAIERTLGARNVVFWKAGGRRPSGCNVSEPDPDTDFETLSNQERMIEKAIRPYLISDLPSESRSLIYGMRNLDLSIGAGTRVAMLRIAESVFAERTGYQYVVQNQTNIILKIMQSVGLEIISVERTCMNLDKKHLMHHITITYK